MAEELFDKLLHNIFSVKGITYKKIEIYLWTDENGTPVKTFDAFEKKEDYTAIFCLSDVNLSINGIPFEFGQFDFACKCVNGQACGLYFVDPDEFRFNSEEELNTQRMTELKDSLMGRMFPVVQSIFSLGSS